MKHLLAMPLYSSTLSVGCGLLMLEGGSFGSSTRNVSDWRAVIPLVVPARGSRSWFPLVVPARGSRLWFPLVVPARGFRSWFPLVVPAQPLAY